MMEVMEIKRELSRRGAVDSENGDDESNTPLMVAPALAFIVMVMVAFCLWKRYCWGNDRVAPTVVTTTTVLP
eukprot:3826753-Rhodomonas_salina.1